MGAKIRLLIEICKYLERKRKKILNFEGINTKRRYDDGKNSGCSERSAEPMSEYDSGAINEVWQEKRMSELNSDAINEVWQEKTIVRMVFGRK